ncbi:unnamed protein product [Victoria cruziana]
MTRSPPFPKALENPLPSVRDREVRMQDMLEMFKVVCINLSVLDAINQVPAHARFLKELCTKKRRSRKILESVLLSVETLFIIQRRIPQKLADPGAPIIPCVRGNICIERPLLDLGASVNVLPVLRGVLENVLVKVEDFIFPVDFIVMDMEGVNAQCQTPIILGIPFFAMANACFNCRTGVLEISFGEQKLRMNIFHVAMGPIGDRCISFAEADDDDADDTAYEVTMSIFTSSIANRGPNFMPDADIAAMYDSSLGLFYCNFYFDSSSHDLIPIDSSFDHSSSSDLVSSHPLSFERREADGGFDVLATTTLHRGRSRPTDFESLPSLALEPDFSSLESPSVMELKLLPHTL